RKEQLRKRATDARLSNVEFHPPQAVERMTEILASFSAVVIPMRQLPISRGAIPSKMLEAMAAGVPILLAGEGDAEALVRDADCGVVVPPEDAAALARAILRLYQDESYRNRLGRNARSYAVRRFERGAINRSFELRLAEIIHGA